MCCHILSIESVALPKLGVNPRLGGRYTGLPSSACCKSFSRWTSPLIRSSGDNPSLKKPTILSNPCLFGRVFTRLIPSCSTRVHIGCIQGALFCTQECVTLLKSILVGSGCGFESRRGRQNSNNRVGIRKNAEIRGN